MSWKGGLYSALHQKVKRGTDRNERDRSEERACGKKVPHTSWADAEEHVQEIIAFNVDRGRAERSSRLHAYRCDFCGFWHVGHGRGPEREFWVSRPVEESRP